MFESQGGSSSTKHASSIKIEPEQFTNFVGEQFPNEGGLTNEPAYFDLDYEWEVKTEKEITCAPKIRLLGETKSSKKYYKFHRGRQLNYCTKFEGLAGGLAEWRDVDLFALYKKEAAMETDIYRPIALLSYLRRIVGKVVDWRLLKKYSFLVHQCVIQELKGIEKAILRAR